MRGATGSARRRRRNEDDADGRTRRQQSCTRKKRSYLLEPSRPQKKPVRFSRDRTGDVAKWIPRLPPEQKIPSSNLGILIFLIFLLPGRRGRRPLSNEPLCASNGEVWGRWWTSTREGVCSGAETGESFADREIFINRRSKSTSLVSPRVIDRKARYQNRPRVASSERSVFRRGFRSRASDPSRARPRPTRLPPPDPVSHLGACDRYGRLHPRQVF
jgi:hypothetical protein